MNLSKATIPVPEYDLTLPSGKTLKYRQYLTKEKKLLLIAQETDNEEEKLNLYLQIIKNCVISTPFDVEDLTLADFEYLILNIRVRSTGDIELDYTCKNQYFDSEDQREKICNGIVHCAIALDEIQIINKDKLSENLILDEELGLGLKLKIPRIRDIVKMENSKNLKNYEKMENLILNSITHLFTRDELIETSDKKELADYLGELPLYQSDKIEKYFDDLPRMEYRNTVVCPFCAFKHDIVLTRTNDFLV